MAIPINQVYQLCYAIAAKQQSAFPSPDNFNLYANLSNIDLFNYYNDERDKMLLRVKSGESLFVPPIIADFVVNEVNLTLTGNSASLPPDYVYDLAFKTPVNGINKRIVKIDYDKLESCLNSSIDQPTATDPIYVELSDSFLLYPTITPPCYLTYYRYPLVVLWNYTIVNGRPVYTSEGSIDYEWNGTELMRLTSRILKYMSVSIRDNELEQYVDQMVNTAS